MTSNIGAFKKRLFTNEIKKKLFSVPYIMANTLVGSRIKVMSKTTYKQSLIH